MRMSRLSCELRLKPGGYSLSGASAILLPIVSLQWPGSPTWMRS